MLRRIFVASMLMCAFSTASAYSGDRAVLCDHCSTHSQFDNAALEAVSYGDERVYVINRISGEIKRYYVIKESEPGYTIAEATEIDPDPSDLDDINNALDVYTFVKNLSGPSLDELQPYLPSGYGGYDSVLDYAPFETRRGVLRDAVNAWASDGILGILNTTLVQVLSKIYNSFGIPITLVVTFPDGSTYKLNFSSINLSGDGQPYADYVLVEARDDEGNQVPESGNLSGLNYDGDRDTINRWGDLADELNWLVRRVQNQCNRVRLTIVCSSGPPKECTIRPEPACP